VDIADIQGESVLLTLGTAAALGCAIFAFGSWLLANYQLPRAAFLADTRQPGTLAENTRVSAGHYSIEPNTKY